ncbi:restriction endonuclease subunit S [Vibrio splendidus]|uniref:restriction endonuclease subunit S n=1 Tax=Vibrio splendidus TaxID=29497 RepID=UPI000D38F63A|nr:restriction endonuclease subunit S [Vibrio splendidus]PTP28805.1 hypothetical protein CWN92_13990 [Vibrio splendidus]
MLTEWKRVAISELGEVITGNTPPRKQPELYGEHTLFVKPTDINVGERYCLNPEECYSESGFKKYRKSLIPKGSTCVVTIGSIGKKIIKAHQDLFINQAMNAVIPNKEYDESFVFYLLKLNLFQLKTFDSGTASGRENVSKSSFSAIKVKVPESKNVQTKIATLLTAYDDFVDNNLEQIRLLEEMAQITYEEWFVRMKFPCHEEVEIDPETGLPSGWSRKKMGEVLTLNYGKALKSGDRNGGNILVYGSAGIVGYHDSALVEGPGIVLGRKGNVGSVYWSHSPFYPIDTVYYVASQTSLYFVYYCLKYQKFVNNDAAVPGLNRNAAYAKKINLPNSELIEQFDRQMGPIFSSINNLQQQVELLKEARDVLLPRLMTGMIDIDKVELPEALLERINKQNNNETNIG